MGEVKEIWKRLFFVLHNNKQPDDDLPTMWTLFKAGNLQDDDLETAIKSIRHLLPDNVREKLKSLCGANKTGAANLLYSMQADSSLKDDFWYLLFRAFRDTGCSPIDDSLKICIQEGGQMKQMTMQELEDKFVSENRDNLRSQTSVPDQMIHEDLIDAYLSTSSVKDWLDTASISFNVKRMEWMHIYLEKITYTSPPTESSCPAGVLR